MRFRTIIACLALSSPALALEAEPDDVYVRVVDGGPALCTVTRMPGEFYMVYDTGHWTGDECLAAVTEIVEGETIHLLVLSHADSDHLGAAPEILEAYDVQYIVRTGFPRWGTATWEEMNEAVAAEAKFGASILNLQSLSFEFGEQLLYDDATVTLIAGWPVWTDPGPTESERRNAISIVLRLDYAGGSVLFTGDTVGRRKSDPDTACKDAEKVMVDNAGSVPIRSNVMIAPHHGGNNGSASCFIAAVDPDFVVFSAGHQHDHPTAGAAERYLAHGVPLDRIFRTDRDDDEGGFEWAEGRVPGCDDVRGDDDVDIVIRANGTVEVAYRGASDDC
jgi:beta-lactamase superfamily II metal-dependent hydrolase